VQAAPAAEPTAATTHSPLPLNKCAYIYSCSIHSMNIARGVIRHTGVRGKTIGTGIQRYGDGKSGGGLCAGMELAWRGGGNERSIHPPNQAPKPYKVRPERLRAYTTSSAVTVLLLRISVSTLPWGKGRGSTVSRAQCR
jgi:hypothetical protein